MNSFIQDFKSTAQDNGYNPDDFEIDSETDVVVEKGGASYPINIGKVIIKIRVKYKKTNKEKIYKIEQGEVGWDQFDKDLKQGFFN